MGEYYLIAQLPSLDTVDDHAPLPITEERFLELTERLLGKRAWQRVQGLTLAPARDAERTGNALIDAWNDGERRLRIALSKVRASKMGKPFDAGELPLPCGLADVACAAVEAKDPMEAERCLIAYRLGFLETLRPADAFSENFVFYYGLKLKLLARMKRFDTELGRSAYKNIYTSVLSKEGLEAAQ